MREQPEHVARWIATNRWVVCPECLWLSVWPRDWPAGCNRPAGELIRYGWGHQRSVSRCECESLEVPAAITESIWSSLLIGGTNAVLELLFGIQPPALGLPTSLEKYKERKSRAG